MTKEYARLKKKRQAKRDARKNRRRRVMARRQAAVMKYALSMPYYGFQKKALEATQITTLKLDGAVVIGSTPIVEKASANIDVAFVAKPEATKKLIDPALVAIHEGISKRLAVIDNVEILSASIEAFFEDSPEHQRLKASGAAALRKLIPGHEPTPVYVHPAVKLFNCGRQFERDSMSKMNRKRLYADAKAANAKKRELRKLNHGGTITIASSESTT